MKETHVATSLLLRRFVFRMAEASAKCEWLEMNRKGPWEGYRRRAKRRLARCLLPLRAHRKRDVWVRGSVATAKRGKTPVCLCLIVLKRARDLRADYQVYQCKSEATSQFLLTIRRLPLYFEVKQFASLSSVSCWINSSPGLSSCISLGWSFSLSYTCPALSSIISLSLVISCWSLSDYVLRKQSNECQYKERRLWCQVKKQLFFPVRQHACFYDTVEQSEHPLTTLLQHCCEIL